MEKCYGANWAVWLCRTRMCAPPMRISSPLSSQGNGCWNWFLSGFVTFYHKKESKHLSQHVRWTKLHHSPIGVTRKVTFALSCYTYSQKRVWDIFGELPHLTTAFRLPSRRTGAPTGARDKKTDCFTSIFSNRKPNFSKSLFYHPTEQQRFLIKCIFSKM